ncbi:MAG: CPBP family glutamic-type intramembrane protease [Elusimicrobiota bacterium]
MALSDWTAGLIFVALAYLISWTIWWGLASWAPRNDWLQKLSFSLGTCGPAAAAIIMRLWVTKEGFSEAGLSLKASWFMYGLAIVLGYLLNRLALFFFSIDTQKIEVHWPRLAGLALPVFLLLALGEELGWRSYLLTKWLGTGKAAAYFCVGIVWALWHLPLILQGKIAAGKVKFAEPKTMALYAFYVVLSSVVLGEAYFLSGRCLAVPVFIHALANAFPYFPATRSYPKVGRFQ